MNGYVPDNVFNGTYGELWFETIWPKLFLAKLKWKSVMNQLPELAN